MNTKSPSNSASEIKRLFAKNHKTLPTPPPFLSEILRHCAQDKPICFIPAIKFLSVCLSLAFFIIIAGNTYAQTTCSSHTPEDPPTEKDGLIALYCATSGDGWTNKSNWLSDKGINQWRGVTTSSSRVTGLSLNRNNLSGTIPTELGNLTNLTQLDLEENQLSGTIPTDLGNLTNLERLWLHANQLSGTIPTELGNLVLRQSLSLYRNSLSGTIPTELGNLTNLSSGLWLHENSLSGTIPTDLGNLTNLKELWFYKNQLSGTIPTELGNLTKLEKLLLRENQLSGTIPGELGNLTKLKWLFLNTNSLSGTIPSELGNLTSLERLYLYENQLSGSMDIELEDMIKLQRLFIQNTMLTPGTAQIEDMETLADGMLQGFGLWGSDDLTSAAKQANSDLGRTIDWAALWAIYVDNNGAKWKNKSAWFSNPSLSNWYGVETNSDGRVEILNLRYNDLKEDITNALEALKDIKRLDLSYNGMLTGELSPRLMDLSSLTELNIRCTGITTPADMDFQAWLQTITLIETQTDDVCSVPPAVPVRMVTVTPQGRSLLVSWEESTDANGYKVQWKSGTQEFNETDRQHTVTGVGSTSYEITGLAVGTEYTVRVIATKSNADKGFARAEFTGIPTPGQVTGVAVTPQGRSLLVFWNTLADAHGYKIQWKSVAHGQQFNETDRQQTVTGVDSTSYAITGLTAGTEYTVRVIATRDDANNGQPSLEVTGIPAPGRVTGVTVTPGIRSLLVSWDTLSDAHDYKVQWKSGTQQFNETNRQHMVTSTSYVITRLTAGAEYTVRVIATRFNTDDGQPSLEDTGTPKASAPGQVTGVIVTPGVQSLSVSWNRVRNADGYKVQWKSGTQEFNETDPQYTVTGGSTTSYAITGLTAGTEYRVRVIAFRAHADDGQPSSPDAMGIPRAPAPGQVTGIMVTPGVMQLSVSWMALSGADGYKVQWKSGGQNFGTNRQHVIMGGSTTSYAITGLIAGREYTVRVIATKLNAEDSPAEIEVAETPRAPAPGQVTGISVTPQAERLLVSWNRVTNADGYKVQWKSGGQNFGTNRQRTVTGGSTTSYTITGLTAGTEYMVRVIAFRAHADDGQPSEADSAAPMEQPPPSTPPSPGTPLPPPLGQVTGISVTPGVQSLSVSWNEVTNADGYKVQWKSGDQDFDTDRQRRVTGRSTTSYTITGLTAGTEYAVRVIATRSGGDDGQLPSEVNGIPEPPDQVVPGDSPAGESGGGCSMISQKTADNMSAKTFLNLLLVVSFMFLPLRKANLFISIGIGTRSIFNRT